MLRLSFLRSFSTSSLSLVRSGVHQSSVHRCSALLSSSVPPSRLSQISSSSHFDANLNRSIPARAFTAGVLPDHLKYLSMLIDAASSGNVSKMQEIVSTGGINVNEGDYDKRRPLHVAAAEGRLKAVEFLIQSNADVNAEDRWGNTPLDEALTGRHDAVIKYLFAKKGQLGRAKLNEMGAILCQAAAENNTQHLQRLVDCKVDLNKPDYDQRTALHVAASEGHLETVKFLIEHGAKMNSVDRFGNTPLSDATRSRAKGRKEVQKYLMEHGAQLQSSDWEIKNDPLLQSSITRSLPFLLLRSAAIHVEAWLPNSEESEFSPFDGSTYTNKDSITKIAAFLSAPSEPLITNTPNSFMGQAWDRKLPVTFHDISEKDFPLRYKAAKESGLKSGVILPVIHKDKPVALLRFFFDSADSSSPITQRSVASSFPDLQRFAAGIITAGIFRSARAPFFTEHPDLPKGQMFEVYERIVSEEVFNANLVYHEVDWFYNLGLQKYYFERFSAKEIANHVHAFIAAKKVAATTGRPEEIMLNIESKAVDGNPSWLYMIPIEHEKQVEVEKRIQLIRNAIPSTKSHTLEFFMSQKTVIPQGKKQMGLYVLETSEWANPKELGKATNHQMQDVASVTFLRSKTKQIQERYQALLTSTVSKISPLAEVFPVYRDGTTPVMFSFYQTAGTTTSYMLQLTELLQHNNLIASRKFIETFNNGVIVFSLYIQPASKQAIDSLLKQFSMLHLVPESSLTNRFLSGEYSAEQYTYNSAASRFVYYFLNKRSEEFDVLAKALKGDAMNMGRLRLLQTRLKREAVSQERIAACLANHPSVAVELFKDFYRVATTEKVKTDRDFELNQDLVNRIKHEATTVLDQQILLALLSFNTHLLKTNFYNSSKAALSFRLDPRFLRDSDWPEVPFGLFFVMGSDFQGFHIRFADIARGGIRVIRSGDRQAYNSNLETLFAENYGLAYTQNKKNKDIPEFGSKGTVLLNLSHQSNPFLAFQKYISGMLDLILKSEDIKDNYGKEEILFMGPDEGTADYMEWAARYAAKRGYPYWRSFTTGKPPSLGGIPHDRFGMTTRSVHRYVLGCLRKSGLKEEEVTKFQTGGPDGDLGSNEILISKDKTRAIVDGSGVLYDPEGLNREELTRLAQERVMIKEFDTRKLGPGGFRVLINESNIKLPNGQIVDSGLAFRNEFHLNSLSSADMFVPCGGRPESVNLTNVNRLFDPKTGAARFRIIVEGANLFFTQDARMVLEQAGVTLYKDASANKGGVTSSSLEVLAALSLSAEEFDQHMAVKDLSNIPPFYQAYVAEIQTRIEADADLEFECIWREHEKSKTHRYLLTDAVSDKINHLNNFIQHSSLWDNIPLRNTVLRAAIPQRLIELCGLDTILNRVPDPYIKAIFGAYLASRYVYRHGLDSNEMAFFEFMQPYIKQSLSFNDTHVKSSTRK